MNGNDLIAFLVEVAVIVLLCVAGFTQPSANALKWLLGLGIPIVAIVLWGMFAAPRSTYDVLAIELLVKVLVLGAGVLAGFLVLAPVWAIVFAVVVVINTVLIYVGPFAR